MFKNKKKFRRPNYSEQILLNNRKKVDNLIKIILIHNLKRIHYKKHKKGTSVPDN